MTTTTEPLVGRDAELGRLEQLLDALSDGAPRFAVITGEPGIGKTSVLSALAGRADERGWLALVGSAAEFEREVPFGLAVDALDEYLQSLGPHAFQRLDRGGSGELAAVFPSLRPMVPEVAPGTAAERFRAHHAVRELLERIAAGKPLVLAFDDVHWADGASLELIASLLRRPPQAGVLLVCAYRTGQADQGLATAIEGAARRGAVDELHLARLEPADADRMLPDAGVADRRRLYERSGGNPFYLLQLARMGDAAPRGVREDVGGVPLAVATAIGEELDALTPIARGLAQAAAVAGDPFELDLAIEASAIGDADALVALDELMARDLVRAGDAPRRFRFRHPLVRAAVYRHIPAGSRLASHERAARVLAARGAPAAARAGHLEQAARFGDVEAVRVLREAGAAASRQAPRSAARWFGAALRLLPAETPAADRLALLTTLARAQAATGRFEESREALLEGIGMASDGGVAPRVRLIAACAAVEQRLGRYEHARRRLLAALDELSDRSSLEAAELMLNLASDAFYRADFERMQAWIPQAQASAIELGDTSLIAAATAVRALAQALTGPVPEAHALREEARTLIDALSDDELALRIDSVVNLGVAELYLDRYPSAESHLRRGLELARRTEQARLLPLHRAGPGGGHLRARQGRGSHGAGRRRRRRRPPVGQHPSACVEPAAPHRVQLARRRSRHRARVRAGEPAPGPAVRWRLDRGVRRPHLRPRAARRRRSGERRPAGDELDRGRRAAAHARGLEGVRARALHPLQPRARSSRRRSARRPVGGGASAGVPAAPADRLEPARARGRGAGRGRFCRGGRGGARVGGGGHPRGRANRGGAVASARRTGADRVRRDRPGRRRARAGGDRPRRLWRTALPRPGRAGAGKARAPHPSPDAAGQRRRGHRRAHRARARDRPARGGSPDEREVAEALFLSIKTVEAHMRNLFVKLNVSSRVEVARVLERSAGQPD